MKSSTYDQCFNLLVELIENPESIAFRNPVLWKENALLDYPKIVKRPMDLGTVKENLMSNKYENEFEFATDVRLIWSNCMIYNQELSELYKMAYNLQILFENRFQEIVPDDKKNPSIPDKKEFVKLLDGLSPQELGKIATMIFEKSKSSLKDQGNNQVEIDLDSIDNATFRIIEAYVKSCHYNEEINENSDENSAIQLKSP